MRAASSSCRAERQQFSSSNYNDITLLSTSSEDKSASLVLLSAPQRDQVLPRLLSQAPLSVSSRLTTQGKRRRRTISVDTIKTRRSRRHLDSSSTDSEGQIFKRPKLFAKTTTRSSNYNCQQKESELKCARDLQRTSFRKVSHSTHNQEAVPLQLSMENSHCPGCYNDSNDNEIYISGIGSASRSNRLGRSKKDNNYMLLQKYPNDDGEIGMALKMSQMKTYEITPVDISARKLLNKTDVEHLQLSSIAHNRRRNSKKNVVVPSMELTCGTEGNLQRNYSRLVDAIDVSFIYRSYDTKYSFILYLSIVDTDLSVLV